MSQSRPKTDSDRAIVAIDFGTTCTGYAYYLSTGDRDYLSAINTEQAWAAAGQMGLQAPTTVLMTPERKFDSFGFEAEKKYKLLAADNKHRDWYYFRHFKMELHHQQEIRRDMLLYDDTRKSMKAIEVFEHAIRYIRNHLRTSLEQAHTTDISLDEIKWVITVPAIWRESAKAFMREAAKLAGIPDAKLRLALEPEAAAIYCKELACRRAEMKDGIPLQTFNPKTRYIILDLGGGTVDTTVHEVLEDGTLKELHAATGGAWGGQLVDAAFKEFIRKLVTGAVFDEFIRNHTKEWIGFCNMFDTVKREFTPEIDQSMIDSFPPSMEKIFESQHNTPLSGHISGTYKAEQVRLQCNSLILNKSIMMSFFNKAINPMCDHIKTLVKNNELKLDYLILIGGFSQSPIVKKEIETHFGRLVRVVAPGERGTAVLKGAVMYGIQPNIITSRISPYTYGVSTRKLYDKKVHASNRKKNINNRDIVYGAFDRHIEKGKDVFVGIGSSRRVYTMINQTDPVVFWKVYQSEKNNPLFCDEDKSRYIGKLKLKIDEKLLNKRISLAVWMECKGTELVAYVKATDKDDERNNATSMCELDFLGDPLERGSDFTESIN